MAKALITPAGQPLQAKPAHSRPPAQRTRRQRDARWRALDHRSAPGPSDRARATPPARRTPAAATQVLADAAPPRLLALTLDAAPTSVERAYTLRLEFSEPVVWSSVLAAAAATAGAPTVGGNITNSTTGSGTTSSGDATAGASAGAAAGGGAGAGVGASQTLQLTDARLLNLTADPAAALLLTVQLPAAGTGSGSPGGGVGTRALQVAGAAVYFATLSSPPGAAARVVVPGGSYADTAGNTGVVTGDIKVRVVVLGLAGACAWCPDQCQLWCVCGATCLL